MCRQLSYFLIIFSFFVYNLSFSFELPKDAETHIEEIKKSAEAWKKGEQEAIVQEELMQKKQRLEELKKTIEKQPMGDKTTTKEMYLDLIQLRNSQLEHDLLAMDSKAKTKETELKAIEEKINRQTESFKRLEGLKQEVLEEIKFEGVLPEVSVVEQQEAFEKKKKAVENDLKELEKDLPGLINNLAWVDLVGRVEGVLRTISPLPEDLQQDLVKKVKDSFEGMKDAYVEASGKDNWQVLADFKALEQTINRKLLAPDQISDIYLKEVEETKQNPLLHITQLMIWKESLEGYGYDEQTKQSVINEFERLEEQIEQALNSQEVLSDELFVNQFKNMLADLKVRKKQIEKYNLEASKKFLNKLSAEDRTRLDQMFLDFSGKVPLDQLAMLIEYVNFQQGLIESLKQQSQGAVGQEQETVKGRIFLKQKSLAQDVELFYKVIDALDLEETTKAEAVEYFERTTPKIAKNWMWREYIQEPGDVTVEQPLSDVFKRVVKQAIWDGISWGAPRAFELAKTSFDIVNTAFSPAIISASGFVWDNLAEPLVLKKLSSYYYSLPIEQRVEARSFILEYNKFLLKTPQEQQQIISSVIDAMKNVKEATQQKLEQAQDVVVRLNEEIKSLSILTQLFKATKVNRVFRISDAKISKVVDSFNKVNEAVKDKANLKGVISALEGVDMEEISEVVKSISENFLSVSEKIKPSLEKFATLLEKDAEAAAQQGKIIKLFEIIEKKLPKEKAQLPPEEAKKQLSKEEAEKSKEQVPPEEAKKQLSKEEAEKSEEQRPQVEGAWQRVKTVFGKLRDNLVDSFRRLRRRFVSVEKDYNQTVEELQAELKKAKGETIEEKFTFIAKSPDGKARLQVLVDQLTRYTREMLTVKQEAEKNAEEFSIAITSFPTFIEAITVRNIENLPQDLTKAVDSFDAITQWRTKAAQEVKQELIEALNTIDDLKQDVNDPVWEFLSGDVFKGVTFEAVRVFEKSQLLFAGELDEAFVSRLKQVQKEVIAQKISALKQLSKVESKDQATSFLNKDNSIQLLSNIEAILFKIKNDLQANDEPSQQEAKVYLQDMQEALDLKTVEQMKSYFMDLKDLFEQVKKAAIKERDLTLKGTAEQAQETIDPNIGDIYNLRGIANILSTILEEYPNI